MLRSKKLFLTIIVLGVLVVAGFLAYKLIPFNGQAGIQQPVTSENNGETSQQSAVPEPTGKVSDLVDSIEKGLYEEASVVYQEDQDVNSATSDSTELNNMAGSTDGAGI